MQMMKSAADSRSLTAAERADEQQGDSSGESGITLHARHQHRREDQPTQKAKRSRYTHGSVAARNVRSTAINALLLTPDRGCGKLWPPPRLAPDGFAAETVTLCF
jgi:hypothetical protein